MSGMRQFTRTRLLVLSVAMLALGGCGGGGGSDPRNPGPPIVEAPTGSVTVLLTDAPSDAFSQIFVTVTSIELLGGDAPVTLFAGEEIVDLLALENFADLFAVADDVPAGSYSKIRLRISDLELVRLDDNGDVLESFRPPLPASGKIDLNPRGAFNVVGGENIVLQLDIDARRSIYIVGNGNNRFRFRPVIFIDVLNGEPTGRSARIIGDITAIDAAQNRFELCQSRPSSARPRSGSDDRRTPQCVTVAVDDGTGFFDENADSIALGDLQVDATVTAIGRFVAVNRQDRPVLAAAVVARGARNTFKRYDGTIESAPDANNRFAFLLDSGQGIASETVIDVEVQPGTGIVDGDGVAADASQIEPLVQAEVEGLLVLSSTDPDTLRAIFVALEDDTDDGDNPGDDRDELRIVGQILSVDATNNTLTLATESADRCVVLRDNGRVFAITTTADSTTTDAIDFADIPSDTAAQIYGREGIDGCFRAGFILVLVGS